MTPAALDAMPGETWNQIRTLVTEVDRLMAQSRTARRALEELERRRSQIAREDQRAHAAAIRGGRPDPGDLIKQHEDRIDDQRRQLQAVIAARDSASGDLAALLKANAAVIAHDLAVVTQSRWMTLHERYADFYRALGGLDDLRELRSFLWGISAGRRAGAGGPGALETALTLGGARLSVATALSAAIDAIDQSVAGHLPAIDADDERPDPGGRPRRSREAVAAGVSAQT